VALALAAGGASRGADAQSSGWTTGNGPGWRQSEKPAGPRAMDLQSIGDGLDRIEATRENATDGRISVEPVTDLMVRIQHAVRRYRRAAADRQAADEARDSFVEASVRIVTGGRLGQPVAAQCDRFDGAMLMCELECDGGWFGLRRGPRPGEHFLVVGVPEPGGEQASLGTLRPPGFTLGACTREQPITRLTPRGGRLSAEVRLRELN
jgi:hypothetical protein